MIKVLLVDDHDLVRTGVNRLLTDIDGIDVVAEATCGEDALKMVVQHELDVVLMDINMPGMGGLEATRKLQSAHPEVKVIIVTMHGDDLFAQRLLKAGAMGYMTKGAGIDEIVHAIKEVKQNRRYISPEIAQQLALSQFPDSDASPFDVLSERELQVMMLLMEGKKVNQISDQLCLSPKTVSTYRHRLYDKLNVKNDIELTRLAIVHGIIENNIPV